MDATNTRTMVVSAATSFAAATFFLRELVPQSVQEGLLAAASGLLARLSNQLTIVVEENSGFASNQMYTAAKAYLATKLSAATRRIRVDAPRSDTGALDLAIEPGEEVVDYYNGVKFTWRLVVVGVAPRPRHRRHFFDDVQTETRYFQLIFHKRHRDVAIGSYLPYVRDRAKALKDEVKALKLYTSQEDGDWTSVVLRHPAKFATVAMEADAKRALEEDLLRFAARRDYYQRIGKPWKRGYLLYGPPGTGKSTLIAAMANLLRYDVYDLELTDVRSNSDLRSLLVNTTSRSILVIEDVDCSMDLKNRAGDQKKQIKTTEDQDPSSGNDESKVTLSGLLNFIDGLWSSCGEERIVVLTTNYKERLDPALLRPGRMDVHVHMGYCGPSAFRMLVSNYHQIAEHPLFGEIEERMSEVEVTPAEVAEQLMRSEDADAALRGVVELLRQRSKEAGEAKDGKDGAEGHGGEGVKDEGEGERKE